MADLRTWTTAFFPDEAMAVDSSTVPSDGITDWTGKGKVLWTHGSAPNELNPRLNPGTLHQPEVIDKSRDKTDVVTWTLFAPSAVWALAKATKAAKALDPVPVTMLLGRGDEELGYGLRVFFERRGSGVLLCLSGREGADPGGRWNVGISQKTIEGIFRKAGFEGKPQVQVLAGYSTGYGMVQTINNDLIPLAPILRMVFFDCIYRCDKPALPKGDAAPVLATADRPEFASAPSGQLVLDVHKETFQRQPFNTRRAIARLLGASKSCVIAAYSTTSGGSPRYGLWKDDKSKLLMAGTRPLVEIPNLADLRVEKPPSGNTWSPSEAYDALILSRYLELGTRAGLIAATDPPASYQAIIKKGVPPRGTVFSAPAIKPLVTVPAGLPDKPVELLGWAATLPGKPDGKARTAAAKLLLAHQLVLPGWEYGVDDLSEYRHAGCLSEFGWELLPP
jgi:hypothetical protein